MYIFSTVTDNYPSWISGRRNESVAGPGIEPGTSGSRVRRVTDFATRPSTIAHVAPGIAVTAGIQYLNFTRVFEKRYIIVN